MLSLRVYECTSSILEYKKYMYIYLKEFIGI